MKPESVDAMLDTYKKMKKRCPKCKKGTTMVSANKAGWVLHCSKCDKQVQVEDGTLIGALRKWNDDSIPGIYLEDPQ